MQKFKKINTIIAMLVGLVIMAVVLLGILFPRFNYILNVPDSHGIALWKAQTDKQNYFYVSPFFSYQFSSISLQLRTKQKFSSVPEALQVFKGYVVQGFEKGEMISTSEELEKVLWAGNKSGISNGALVSRGETVYFVSEGKARAILAPEIFLQLGFQWDSVQPVGSEQFSLLEEGEKVSFGSIHPTGTFFSSGDNLFVFVDGQRRQVGPQLSAMIPSTIVPVILEKEELSQIGTCTISGNPEKKIGCTLIPQDTTAISGNDYIFQVPQNIFDTVEKGSVTFRTLRGMSGIVARSSLKRIKDTLALRYFPEITK